MYAVDYPVTCKNCNSKQTYTRVLAMCGFDPMPPQNVCSKCGSPLTLNNVIMEECSEEATLLIEAEKEYNDLLKEYYLEKCE